MLRQISFVEIAVVNLGSGAPQAVPGSLYAVGVPVAEICA
jgi:hypothetical protein